MAYNLVLEIQKSGSQLCRDLNTVNNRSGSHLFLHLPQRQPSESLFVNYVSVYYARTRSYFVAHPIKIRRIRLFFAEWGWNEVVFLTADTNDVSFDLTAGRRAICYKLFYLDPSKDVNFSYFLLVFFGNFTILIRVACCYEELRRNNKTNQSCRKIERISNQKSFIYRVYVECTNLVYY